MHTTVASPALILLLIYRARVEGGQQSDGNHREVQRAHDFQQYDADVAGTDFIGRVV